MADSRATAAPLLDKLLDETASPPLGRWLNETAYEEPWSVVPGQTQFPLERRITKRSSQPSSNVTGVARDDPAANLRHPVAGVLPIFCRYCAERFTGNWRESNLARHLRLKHRSDLSVPCSCSLCHKTYKRSDALLKHERRQHPELRRAPPAGRPRPSLSPSSSFEPQQPSRIYPPHNSYPEQHFTREPLPVASSTGVVRPQHLLNHPTSPKGSGQHRLVVQTGLEFLTSKLENSSVPNASNLLDNNLVLRWEPILLQLRNRESGLYASCRHALGAIRAVVQRNHTDNVAESLPQQNANAASQAGYHPEFENQTTNQPEFRAAFAIILRDAIAIVSQLYEEGESSLPHGEMQQLLTEIEDEVHFRLQPHGRNNMEAETLVTATTSALSALGHEDRLSVDHQPFYEHQSPFNNDDRTCQLLQRNSGDIAPHSTNYSASLSSEPSSAPYYGAVNYLPLQVPNQWAASPGYDSAYVSTPSAPLDKPGPSTFSHPFDHASERSLHSLHPESDFHPGPPFPTENQPYPELQLQPEPPPF